MTESSGTNRGGAKIRRLSELPRDIPPPRDGWPALEVRLRESAAVPHRRSAARTAAIAAACAALGAGILVDRLILQRGHPTAPITGPPAALVTDPHYLAERAALLASLDARLNSLPPQTRKQVLASLETIHRSMQAIQRALGREPGNALLQGLLIDSYQDEMQVLTTVQEAGAGSGEI